MDMYIDGKWMGASSLPDHVGGPFGGMKISGTHARELGPEGMESFMETKHLHWEFEPETITDNWFRKK